MCKTAPLSKFCHITLLCVLMVFTQERCTVKIKDAFSPLYHSWGRRDSTSPSILTTPMEYLRWWALRSQALEESFYLARGSKQNTQPTPEDKAMMYLCGWPLTNR